MKEHGKARLALKILLVALLPLIRFHEVPASAKPEPVCTALPRTPEPPPGFTVVGMSTFGEVQKVHDIGAPYLYRVCLPAESYQMRVVGQSDFDIRRFPILCG